jgi:hypothetical protein
VTAWKLPGGETVTPDRPWMMLEGQPGFAQRSGMVAALAGLVLALRPGVTTTVTDLGCGDGSLLAMLHARRAWGYELGAGDVAHGQRCGLDVRQADILADDLEYGNLLIASEVLEHLADPVAFLKGLPDRLLIASSPSCETGTWFNPIHTWAFDLDGYRELIESAGWRVLYQTDCDGGMNKFDGIPGRQRFQAVVAVKP